MRHTINTLPREVFVMCIAFAIDGQPAGPLEYIMVSKHWQQLLLETPSLWSQVYLQNGEDEISRICTFLYLSQNHSLHVDIMTVLPNMDSLQLITGNISRVWTISIRPGPSEKVTYLYMEQWKRSASYILATLYNNLLPSLVLSNVDHIQCPGLSLRENDQWCYWVIFMQLTMRTSRHHDPFHRVSVKATDNWTYFRMWEEHITRTIGGSADQVARASSINLTAEFVSYVHCRDAIRMAIPAFVTLLKDDSDSIQAVATGALDKFVDYVELHDPLKLALVEQLGHENIQIRTSIIPAFLKLALYTEVGGSMMLPPPLLLELFDDPNVDAQMSTISRLMKLAEYVKYNEPLTVTILSLIEQIRRVNAKPRGSAVSVLKKLAAYDEFDEQLRVAILPLIELLGHSDPSVQTAALDLVQSLNGCDEFDEALRAIILSLIERLGDEDPGVRISAISVARCLAKYRGFDAALRVAIPSLIEHLGDENPGVRTSAVSVVQSLAEHSDFDAALRDAIPSLIERIGDKHPGVRTSAVSVLQSLAVYNAFHAELKVGIPSIINQLGDKEPGIRTSAVSVVQVLARYSGFDRDLRVAILSLTERLGHANPESRQSAISVLKGLIGYIR